MFLKSKAFATVSVWRLGQCPLCCFRVVEGGGSFVCLFLLSFLGHGAELRVTKMPVGGGLQGAYFAWKATAMGKNQVNGKTFLEKRYDALWLGGGLVL